jgi:hypothetical protein
MVLLVDVVAFIGPMLVFTDKLWACRTKGVGQYMSLAAACVSTFEARWIGRDVAEGASLLNHADLLVLSSLDGAVRVVREMRWITAGPRLLFMMGLAAIGPFLPLLLFEYPIAKLAQKFLTRLIGL